MAQSFLQNFGKMGKKVRGEQCETARSTEGDHEILPIEIPYSIKGTGFRYKPMEFVDLRQPGHFKPPRALLIHGLEISCAAIRFQDAIPQHWPHYDVRYF